jgi:hypothetical protein|tara:strand:- start:471 stop:644 length:174 start_codon:yes stop_codon:yes gene_type:complete
MNKEELLNKFYSLQEKKKETTDWMESLEIQDEIHGIEMKLNGVKPTDSSQECEGCGS